MLKLVVSDLQQAHDENNVLLLSCPTEGKRS